MPTCEMCGKDGELFQAVIEGAKINVCKNCAKFGTILKKLEFQSPVEKKAITKPVGPQIIEYLHEEYSALIKNARERLGLTQKEFALKINEKESLIHNIESGRFEPGMDLAKKLEKFLKIKLIESYEEKKESTAQSKPEGFTIGDFIKVKK